MSPYGLYGGTLPHEHVDTSVQAALEIEPVVGRLRGEVLECIREAGLQGCTDDELEILLEMRHQTASARRRELALMGLVEDSGRRRRTRSGRKACVWVLKGEE